MKKKNGITFLFIFLILITVISGFITFRIVDKKTRLSKKNLDDLEDNTEEIVKLEEQEIAKVEDNIKGTFEYSDSLFDGVETIYIYNPKIDSNVVEVTNKDKSFIISYLKGISKIKSSSEKILKDIQSLDKFDYQISIPDINIKINLFKKGYIVFQTKKNTSGIYSVNNDELKDFINILENTYIDKQLSMLLEPLPDKIYINARDEDNTYILNDKEIEEILERLKIISLENNSDFMGAPATYPDYYLNLYKGDVVYNIHLINEEVMILETPMLYLYCKYNSELWEYVTGKIPPKKDYNVDELEYLFNSEKVIVNDITGNYSMQNSTYYNIMIPRWFTKSEYKKINNEDNVLDGKDLKYNLNFLVDGQWKDVLIYDNYIVYENNIYFSKNISEAITSLLIAP